MTRVFCTVPYKIRIILSYLGFGEKMKNIAVVIKLKGREKNKRRNKKFKFNCILL